MEEQIIFGTYNVPPIEENLTASYTTNSDLKINQHDIDMNESVKVNSYDIMLKGLLNVPKPKK